MTGGLILISTSRGGSSSSNDMALARKAGHGWMSEGCQTFNRNLKSRKESLKQKSWNTYKVFWMPVLSRGKLHVEVFGEEFPGECAQGEVGLNPEHPLP